MRAGRLKNKVSIQNYTATQSSTGHPAKTWSTVSTVWAGVEALRGKETDSASELIGTLPVRVILRYSSTVASIDTSYRVLFGSRIFSIESVILPFDRSGNTGFIELNCVEGKKDGG